MRNLFLLILSFLIFSNVLAKDVDLINPCTNENILLDEVLSNKSILLNNRAISNQVEAFFISYLDKDREACYKKKYDLFFKVNDSYIYNKELFNDLNNVYPEVSVSDNVFMIDFEYGNGQSNIERYYLTTSSGNIYLDKKDIIYSRSGKSKEIKFNNINIKDVEFSKLINIY
ncbi:hypothetical protein [Aggregatibacter aphrophilus]|uniref:hypothetical protein n=1 Tax=Aggregatibacter aphrophilus TaxID=732 RepID=UPI000D646B49|nr:hypothetical protein [Aggregatibacter aphrophilus]